MERITHEAIQKSNPMIWAGIPRVKKPTELNGIIELCCLYNCITTDDIYLRTRKNDVVQARQIAWYFCEKKMQYKYPVIGSIFGFDRTTVMHGIHQIKRRLSVDTDLQKLITTIEEKM